MTGVPRRKSRPDIAQGALWGGLPDLQTLVIAQRKDFESLFDGFNKMRAISYVVSPDLLLDFLDKRGYKEVEVVVGENLSDPYRRGLEQKGTEVVERLADMVEKGALRVFVSKRTIHTKLYILEKDAATRVIQTSANLTMTAEEARQINYAWYFDLPEGNPLLNKLLQDYESHKHGCTFFMEDLQNLIKQQSDTDKKQVIEAWLKGVAYDEEDTETRQVFQELAVSLVQSPDVKEESVAILRLPEAPAAKKRLQRELAPLKPVSLSRNQLQVNKSDFVRHVYQTHNVPMLVLSTERQKLFLGIEFPMICLTEAPADALLVNLSLEHVEEYINTVDFGESVDRMFAKASMFEALLYIFFTPFAHEYMKAKRSKYGLIDRRGPRFLYIYGPSKNGKTTFLHFALKLLTGNVILPLSRQDFTKTRIFSASLMGTAFPLVFDDVDPSRTPGIEDIFKSYWERWWGEQYMTPQIVIASNTPRLKEWAKSRVKRVDFDVHFASGDIAKAKLNELLKVENPIFHWFSCLYLRRLSTDETSTDDEIQLARKVMKELYKYAQRPIPRFFPDEPVEKLYDPGKRDWRDAIYLLNKAKTRLEGNRIVIQFSPDMQRWEISDYEGYLPQTIKLQRKGNTLIVDNPKELDKWLGPPPKSDSWLYRLVPFKKKRS